MYKAPTFNAKHIIVLTEAFETSNISKSNFAHECTKCGEEKVLNYFAKKKDKWHSSCKDCHNKYCRDHYNKNRQYYINKARR